MDDQDATLGQASFERDQLGTALYPDEARTSVTHGAGVHAYRWIKDAMAFLRLLRPSQWSKNLLIFAPLVLSHQFLDREKATEAVVAFVVFSMIASAVYILNDLIDIDADRRHPNKRHRPLAAGLVSIPLGVTAMVLLSGTGLLGGLLLLPWTFALLIGLYAVLTTAYTVWLKKRVALDVIVLAGFYTLRVIAGGAAVDVPVSEWLLGCCMFLFVSLAILKRYLELQMAAGELETRKNRRGYSEADLPILECMGVTCGCMAVLVLCLYVNSAAAALHYVAPKVLWLMAPILLYWILRLWMLARRGVLAEDPVTFFLRDRVSYALGGLAAVVFLLASFARL